MAETARNGREIEAEVAVVGGGMAGMCLGIALARAGLRTVVVERQDPADLVDEPYDGRASAIAFATGRMLEALGVWEGLAAHACPIEDIRISDGSAPFFLHYDQRDLPASVETGDWPAMGHIIENRAIRVAMQARAAALSDRLTVLAPAALDPGQSLRVSGARAALSLADGRVLSPALVVAADGRRSKLRGEAGIGCATASYGQHAIVCTAVHDAPHRNIAHERFLPAGPFALLPMVGTDETPHRSSVVWTEPSDRAAAIMGLDDAAFGAELTGRFGDTLGPLRLEGRRWSYPLELSNAERYAAPRLALVGDAAHAIHPVAGQGLNLGLRDVAALAEVVVEARRIGLDIGGAEVLARYERWRRVDSLSMIAVTDGLVRLFSNDLPPVRLARDLGLAAVNRMAPLKRFFMRHAMGEIGDRPRLLRGEMP